MVKNLFENKFALKSKAALELIQQLFKSGLTDFEFVRMFDEGIYFGAVYRKNDIEIRFGGDRGYFDHKIMINDKEYSLRHFDKNMDSVRAASEKNYRFAFEVLKQFLNEKNWVDR
jgi:hypothetical protein